MNTSKLKYSLYSFEQTKAYFLCIAGFIMALVHLGSVFFSNANGYYQTKTVANLFYYARFIAYFNITIPCVAAMTYFIVFMQNKHKPTFKYDYLKVLIKLFFILFLVENIIELIMNFPNVTLDFYSFAVLQFTGISLILIHLIINFMGLIYLVAFGLLCLFSSPFLFDFFRSNGILFFSGSNNYEFQWPLFPWLVVPISGFVFSVAWNRYNNYKKEFFLISSFIFFAMFFWVRTMISIQLDTRWGDAVFQPGTLVVIHNIFIIPILMYISEKISEIRLMKRYDIVDLVSRGILFFYFIHIIFTEVLLNKFLNKKFIHIAVDDNASLNSVLLLGFSFVLVYVFMIFFSLVMTKIYLIVFVDHKILKEV